MKTLFAVISALFIAGSALAAAGSYEGICPLKLQEMIFKGEKHAIVDVQAADEFKEHNYEGSIPTAGDARKVGAIADANARGDWPVVVVGSKGGAEEESAAKLLAARGVKPSRILILEGGMEAALEGAGDSCCKVAEVRK